MFRHGIPSEYKIEADSRKNALLIYGPEARQSDIQEMIMRVDNPEDITGIGVVLGIERQNLVVKGILPGSDAGQSNAIRVCDHIIAVAQENMPPVQVKGLNLDNVIGLIRGPKGTTVRLSIISAGEEESPACVARSNELFAPIV